MTLLAMALKVQKDQTHYRGQEAEAGCEARVPTPHPQPVALAVASVPIRHLQPLEEPVN